MILLDRMGDSAFEHEEDKKRLFPPQMDKSLSSGMQVDKEETKEVVRLSPYRPPVSTVERGLQVSLELTHNNLLHFTQPQTSTFFKVPKSKKKQKAKDRDLQTVSKPRKRIFHEANYSDLDHYEFAVLNVVVT